MLLVNTGIITLPSKCKAYGIKTILQTQNVVGTNITGKDISPAINLSIDCCDA